MRDSIRSMFFLAIAMVMIAVAQSTKPAADGSLVIGDWRGDSICAVHPSACNDEKALYHFKKLGDQPNRFSVQADRIVNGKAVDMGAAMECSFAPEKQALTCSTPRLVLHLTLNGNSLDGTMNLPDGTVWRNINLKKDGS